MRRYVAVRIEWLRAGPGSQITWVQVLPSSVIVCDFGQKLDFPVVKGRQNAYLTRQCVFKINEIMHSQ